MVDALLAYSTAKSKVFVNRGVDVSRSPVVFRLARHAVAYERNNQIVFGICECSRGL